LLEEKSNIKHHPELAKPIRGGVLGIIPPLGPKTPKPSLSCKGGFVFEKIEVWQYINDVHTARV
jgi:hypothetical protein